MFPCINNTAAAAEVLRRRKATADVAMQLHVSSVSGVKIDAATVLAYGAPLFADGVVGHDVPHIDHNNVERVEQPYTLLGTFAAAGLRHAAAQHLFLTPDDSREALVTFENGIVKGADLHGLCTQAALDDAAAGLKIPVADVAGDVAVIILSMHSVTEYAVSPVRLFPAGMERDPAVLLEHFRRGGQPRSAQLAAGAARVIAAALVTVVREDELDARVAAVVFGTP